MSFLRHNIKHGIAAVMLMCALCGCATMYNPATGRKEFIFINDETEIAMGRNVVRQIAKETPLWRNSAAQSRVESVGRRIAEVSDRSELNYEFYILDDKELNAMALPGGFVYINRGLLTLVTDDELAFILGHEVGHVAARHSVKKLQSAMGFQLLLTLAFSFAGEKNAQAAGNIAQASDMAYNLISLGYSRQDEYAADTLGVKYASLAGFNPKAAIAALQKIKKAESQSGKVPIYLRSHPYIDDRIKALEKEKSL